MTAISQRAIDLIIEAEIGSEDDYLIEYARPEWPGVDSGVTIGIGYDLGQQDAATICADWGGRVPDDVLVRLAACAGVTGRAAIPVASGLHSVVIDWHQALAVFMARNVTKYTALTIETFPGIETLGPDCLGALVSLVFNRGARLTDAPGESRRREMRQIRDAIIGQHPDLVPDLLRSMKRLWVGQNADGLLRRRDAEADLFTDGLANLPADIT